MQFDSTLVAIRERDLNDLFDLSLRVVRAYAWPLLIACTLGILPFALANAWLLALIQEGPRNHHLYGGYVSRLDYAAQMVLLVFLETPLATAPATLLLGQAMFTQRIDRRRLIGDWLASLPQLLFFQVVLRGLLMLVSWFLLFAPLVAFRFLNEIILLERNPVFRSKRAPMTTWKRCRALHAGSDGDLLGRSVSSLVIGATLLGVGWLSLCYVGSLVTGAALFAPVSINVYFPIAIWSVVSFLTVVRFLSYIDKRIRREGWEVELRMRTEAARLVRQPT